jgi:16S rRNA (uracil1498-N3)-methyltransferase
MPGHFTFYTSKVDNGKAYFDEAESKHAILALRYKIGDSIEFTDGLGSIYKGEISKIESKGFECKIADKEQVNSNTEIVLAMGILKHADRMEWMVEKCTELGASAICFLQTDKSERTKVNLERMGKVAKSALKQSHGAWLPELSVKTVDEIVEMKLPLFVAHCRDELRVNATRLASLPAKCIILIGPEGDFSAQEVEKIHNKGAKDIDMGAAVLRTETAAMAAVAAVSLQYR